MQNQQKLDSNWPSQAPHRVSTPEKKGGSVAEIKVAIQWKEWPKELADALADSDDEAHDGSWIATLNARPYKSLVSHSSGKLS